MVERAQDDPLAAVPQDPTTLQPDLGPSPAAPAAGPLESEPLFVEAPMGERIQLAANLGPGARRIIESELRAASPVARAASEAARVRSGAILSKLLERTGEDLPDKAININFSYLDAPDKVNELIDVVAQELEPVMQTARRGRVSQEQTARDAHELGLTTRDLLSRETGVAWNDRSILAARYIMSDSRDRLDELANAISEGNASDALKLEFQQQLLVHSAIQSQIHGLAAEAGRALAQFKIIARAGESGQGRVDFLVQQAQRGAVPIEQIAAAYRQLPTQRGKDIFARKANRIGTVGMLRELYINSLLSGLPTQAVNILGNSLSALWLPAERMIAGSVAALHGGGVAGVREGASMMYGQAMALRDAMALALFTLRNESTLGELQNFRADNLTLLGGVRQGEGAPRGDPTMGLGKIEGRGRAITAENVGLSLTEGRNLLRRITGQDTIDAEQLQLAGPIAAGVDFLGKVIRLPGRGLQAMDEFYKTIAFRGQLHALAYRSAVAEGLSGKEAAERAAQIIADPPDEMLRSADAFAHYATFTENLDSQIGRGLQNVANGGAWIVAPFVRTPVNLVDFSTERILAPLRVKWWRELLSEDPATRDMAVGKAAAGGLVWMGVTAMVAERYQCEGEQQVCIIGAAPPPKDKARGQAFKRLGLQEYSVGWLNDDGSRTWYSFNRTDPVGQMLGIAADIAQIMQYGSEEDGAIIASAAVAAIGNNLVSKTYMQGIADAMEVFTSFDHNQFKRWMARQAAGFVPFSSAIAGVERTLDPASRQVRADLDTLQVIVDRIKSRVPGLSADLPPYRNVWGEVQYLNTALNLNWLSPIYIAQERTGPAGALDRELLELGVPVNMPQRQIYGVPLQPWEYDRYVQLAGNGLKLSGAEARMSLPLVPGQTLIFDLDGLGFHDALIKLSRSGWWAAATSSVDPPGQKVTAVKQLQLLYREAARARMLAEHPEVASAVRTAKSLELMEGEGIEPEDAEIRVHGEMTRLQFRAGRAAKLEADAPLQRGQNLENPRIGR